MTYDRPYSSVWDDLNQVSFSQGFLDAGPYRTRYLHSGPDVQDAPALLMLHGTTGHAEAYARNLGAHGEHFSTWALDFLGHGWTAKPEHPLEIRHYADHVLGFMDALGIDKASITGESLGGWVAARLARTHPDRVERLVMNTPGGTMANPTVMEQIRTLTTEAAQDPTWERIRTRLQWLMADPDLVTDDLIRTRQAIFEQPGWSRACEATLVLQDLPTRRQNMLSDDDLRAVKVPTMVVWTTHDPSGPVDEGRRIASLIPGALFAVIANAGHWPQYEQPTAFNAVELDFLLGRDRVGSGHPLVAVERPADI